MHDLTHGLLDREYRKELRREAEINRQATEARRGQDEPPDHRIPGRTAEKSRQPSTEERDEREAPAEKRSPS